MEYRIAYPHRLQAGGAEKSSQKDLIDTAEETYLSQPYLKMSSASPIVVSTMLRMTVDTNDSEALVDQLSGGSKMLIFSKEL
jgi:hypothetical protein